MDMPQSRSELAETLFRLRRTFYALAVFSGVINLLMLTPAIYMLQVYDRALVSSNVTTLLMLTVGLYVLLALLEVVRSSVLIRVGNRLDMMLNQRVFSAAFERNLRRAGGNPAQALQDLSQVRQFLTGSGLFAFFDAPWTPIYLLVIALIHPLLGIVTLIGSLLVSLAWLTEVSTRKPLTEANQAALASGSFANNNLRNAEVIEAMGMLPALRQRWFGNQPSADSRSADPGLRPCRLDQRPDALRPDHPAVADSGRRRMAGDPGRDHAGHDDRLFHPQRTRPRAGRAGDRHLETAALQSGGLEAPA